jgi:hypothetical protein
MTDPDLVACRCCMACAGRRFCGFLLLLVAVVLMVACLPSATSSEVEEWDLFAGRELLQVEAEGRKPPRNNTVRG